MIGAARACLAGASGAAGGDEEPAGITIIGRETFNQTTNADPVIAAITVPMGVDFVLVKLGWESSRTVSDLKIGDTEDGANGTSLTKDSASAAVQDVQHTEIWYGNWTATGTKELWIDQNASGIMAGEVVYLSGVHQSNPIADSDAGVTNGGSSVQTAGALVPDGTCLLEAVLSDGTSTESEITWTGATQDNAIDPGGGVTYTAHAEAVTTNVTVQASRASGSQDMALSAVLLRPAA